MKKTWMFLAVAALAAFLATGCGMSEDEINIAARNKISDYLVDKNLSNFDITDFHLDKVDDQNYKGYVIIDNNENDKRKWLIVVKVEDNDVTWDFDKSAAKAAPANAQENPKAAPAKKAKTKKKAADEESAQEAAPEQQKEEEYQFED